MEEKGQANGQQAPGAKDVSFPAYNQMNKPLPKDRDGWHLDTTSAWQPAQNQDEDFVKAMQKLLNTNRRLDGKIRRAFTDAETCEEQWREFQDQLRASFVEQRRKFQADSQKAQQEMLELQTQKQDLVAQIQNLVLSKDTGKPKKKTQVLPLKEDISDISAWHELMELAGMDAEEDQMHVDPWRQPAAIVQEAATTVQPVMNFHTPPRRGGPPVARLPTRSCKKWLPLLRSRMAVARSILMQNMPPLLAGIPT